MKTLRWLAIIAASLLCSAASFADGLPPDGNVGIKSGSNSTPITSTVQNFTFTSCTGSGAPAECGLFGSGVQAIFAGINESGVAFSSLAVILNFPTTITTDLSITCDAAGIFQFNNCASLTTVGKDSLTVQFLQGNGSGIGCYDTTGAAYDTTCLTNSIAAQQYNILHPGAALPYDNPVDGSCPPGQVAGEVCGSNDFVIGIGYGQGNQWNDIPTGGTLLANPEPPTFLLVGGAVLSMLAFGLKKARLIYA